MSRRKRQGREKDSLRATAFQTYAWLNHMPPSQVQASDGVTSIGNAVVISNTCGVALREIEVPTTLGRLVRLLKKTAKGQ